MDNWKKKKTFHSALKLCGLSLLYSWYEGIIRDFNVWRCEIGLQDGGDVLHRAWQVGCSKSVSYSHHWQVGIFSSYHLYMYTSTLTSRQHHITCTSLTITVHQFLIWTYIVPLLVCQLRVRLSSFRPTLWTGRDGPIKRFHFSLPGQVHWRPEYVKSMDVHSWVFLLTSLTDFFPPAA